MSNLCDGSTYIINLSNFIKSHEAQLANSVLTYKKPSKNNQTDDENNNNNDTLKGSKDIRVSASANLGAKPVRLSLTLHHLYFLLDSFNQINLKTGPLNIRLYDIDHDYTMNSFAHSPYHTNSSSSSDHQYSEPNEQQEYVSFLSNNYYNSKSKRLSNYSSSVNSNDNSSITSISSVKSALSSIWNSISINGYGASSYDHTNNNNNIADNPVIVSHLKYLYSCFSKLPCLRLSPDSNSKLIKNYQEFPFDTIVPIINFKSLSILEINEINPKELFGWHNLAESLKFLIIKNFDLNNKIEMVLVDLLWQDYNNRNYKLMNSNAGHNYTNSLPNSLPTSPIQTTFNNNNVNNNDKKKLNKKRHKSFANIRKKRTTNDSINKRNQSHETLSKSIPDVLSFKDTFYQSKWKNLRYLSFTNANLVNIDKMECFKLLENLNSLDLSGNKLTNVPLSLKHLRNLKSINLSDNNVINLENFKLFVDEKTGGFAIKELSLITLKHNEIRNLKGIEFLEKLTKIDLSYNKIKFLKDLKPLILSGVELISYDEDDNIKNDKKLVYKNLDLLNEIGNFDKINIKHNPNRSILSSLNLAGNPLQLIDKNYRIKIFNLCKLFNWVKLGLKINGSTPSYFESYYLFNDEFENVGEIYNSNTQSFLNFKKYLFDNDDYYHQYKPGTSIIDNFIVKDNESDNSDVVTVNGNNPGILKSISNYSLHIFTNNENKKKSSHNRQLTMPLTEKENNSIFQTIPTTTTIDEPYLIENFTDLNIEKNKQPLKTFPETFDTNPIPVNIKGNKLYLNNPKVNNKTHQHYKSLGALDGINYFPATVSPTIVSVRNKEVEVLKDNPIDYTKIKNNYEIIEPDNVITDFVNSFTPPQSITIKNNQRSVSGSSNKGMSSSKSLNNLLNLSQSLKVDTTKTTKNYNIRSNTVFDHSNDNKIDTKRASTATIKQHERTKSSLSSHTLTD